MTTRKFNTGARLLDSDKAHIFLRATNEQSQLPPRSSLDQGYRSFDAAMDWKCGAAITLLANAAVLPMIVVAPEMARTPE